MMQPTYVYKDIKTQTDKGAEKSSFRVKPVTEPNQTSKCCFSASAAQSLMTCCMGLVS